MRSTLPLPPCPCPVCGQLHSHFVSGSSHGVRGAGRGILTQPHSPYRLHMTDDEVESAIYGPLTRSLNPECPCRVVSIHEAAAAHGMDPEDVGAVRAGFRPTVPAQYLHGLGSNEFPVGTVIFGLIVASQLIAYIIKHMENKNDFRWRWYDAVLIPSYIVFGFFKLFGGE